MATPAEIQWIQQNQSLAQQLGFSAESPNGSVANYVKSWYDQQGNNAPAPDQTDTAVFQSTGVFPNNMPSGSTGSAQQPVNNTALNVFGGSNDQLGQTVQTALQKGATGATSNPNTQQVQGSSQQGQFVSTGNTQSSGTQQQTGSQQQTQNTTQNQTGTMNQQQVGQQTNQQTGTTQSTGTSKPIDTLGLGALLGSQAGNAAQTTDATRGFLTDLMVNGPSNQQALTEQAVNQATSGPGMVGAGQGANDRAAAEAAAQVGTNALNQRMQAASQLSGPTAATTLAQAGNAFIGQQNTGNQINNTTGVQNTSNNTSGATTGSTTGSSNSLNLTDLVNKSNTNTNESQAGSSSATGAQIGVGQSPTQQQTSSGGCYVCTAFVDLGRIEASDVAKAAQWKLSRPEYRRSLVGYSIYGPALARLVQRSKLARLIIFPVAQAILKQELNLREQVRGNTMERLCHAVFHYGSLAVAVLAQRLEVKQCDDSMVALLRKHNLEFDCK